MRRPLTIIAAIAVLGATTGCTTGLTDGDRIGDSAHAFVLEIGQVIDKIGGETAPDEQAFLVIRYGVENLGSQTDTERDWAGLLTLESDEVIYEPVSLAGLEGEMRTTRLAAGETATGRLAYTVPDEVADFTLTVTLPVSGTKEAYGFRPVDRRIGVNTEFVLTRLDQIERTKRIAVVGGVLASFSRAPIRYLGTVLVPVDEIDDRLEETRGKTDTEREAIIEAYLIANGHGQLE
jgi:hypothetical protein